MKTVKTYSTSVEAEVARIALDAAGIPAVVPVSALGWKAERGAYNCSSRMITSNRL